MAWVAVPLLLVVGLALAVTWSFSTRMIARRKPDEHTSPSDLDLAFEEIEFPARDGLLLRGWFIPASDAERAVIFCHGHAGSMDPDVKYAPWFNQVGINVLMFDFRGHGRSEGEHVSLGILERNDLLGAVDYLVGRGFTRLGVLGFSMGGAVAILTTPQDERIAAVVSDGGFARLGSTVINWARERGVPDWLSQALSRVVPLVAGLRLGVSLKDGDPVDWVGQISPRPLLLVHGDRDPYVSVADVEALYAAAGEPRELWRVAEAGHRRVDDLRPQEYRERVVGFFERYLA